MIIRRKSSVSGIEREMDLPITSEQWNEYMRGELIQKAFPHLTAGQREFIMTGITDEEWDSIFREREKEE